MFVITEAVMFIDVCRLEFFFLCREGIVVTKNKPQKGDC